MTAAPDEDERRIHKGLRALGVSYAPQPPAADPDAWFDELYADDDEGEEEGPADPSAWFRKLSGRLPDWRKGEAPDLGGDDPDDEAEATDEPDWEDAPRPDESTPAAVKRGKRHQEVHAAWIGLEGRMRWLLIAGAQAGVGWFLGLEQAMRGWIVGCAHDQGNTAALILGVGMVGAGAYAAHRARSWWPPLAWVCRIPFATALLALCLYAPGGTS